MRQIIATEAQEQKVFVEWFKIQFPRDKIIYIHNGGTRSNAEKSQQKALGLCAGASDLYIPRWHLWIEMKRKKNWALSKKQRSFSEYVMSIGDNYVLGIGADDAIEKTLKIIKFEEYKKAGSEEVLNFYFNTIE